MGYYVSGNRKRLEAVPQAPTGLAGSVYGTADERVYGAAQQRQTGV